MSVRVFVAGLAAVACLGAAAAAEPGVWEVRADPLGPKFGFVPEGAAEFESVAVYCLAPGLVKVVVEGFPQTPGEAGTGLLRAGPAEASFSARIENSMIGEQGHVAETTALLDPRLRVFASRLPLQKTTANGDFDMGEAAPAEAWIQFQSACGGALVTTQGVDEVAVGPESLMASSLTTVDQAAPTLHPALQAFAPLIGKTYRGEPAAPEAPADHEAPANPDAAAPLTSPDIQVWEAALGGGAIRTRHALEDGTYGGESLIYPRSDGKLAYVYVTTAGFQTTGTMSIDADGAWTASERVKGHDTVARVNSRGAIEADGTLSTRSTYINKDGSETPGHAFIYREVEARDLVWPSFDAR